MFDLYEKRKIQRILYSRYFLTFMCVPIGFLSYAAYNAHTAERESRARQLELQEELATVSARADALQKNIDRLKDPYGVEAELRQRYEVGKEGEEAIVLVIEDNSNATATPVAPLEQKNVWQKIRGWF